MVYLFFISEPHRRGCLTRARWRTWRSRFFRLSKWAVVAGTAYLAFQWGRTQVQHARALSAAREAEHARAELEAALRAEAEARQQAESDQPWRQVVSKSVSKSVDTASQALQTIVGKFKKPEAGASSSGDVTSSAAAAAPSASTSAAVPTSSTTGVASSSKSSKQL